MSREFVGRVIMADLKTLTLEDIVQANEKWLPLVDENDEEIGKVKIRTLGTTFIIETFDRHDREVPDGEEEVDLSLKEEAALINDVVIKGLVDPEVDADTVDSLGRYKTQVFLEIMKFSGLLQGGEVDDEEGEMMDEAFPEDSDLVSDPSGSDTDEPVRGDVAN